MKHEHECVKAKCQTAAQRGPAFFNRMDGPASEKARERMAAVKKWRETHGIEHNRSECRS